ncbi:MAG: hypothetical protein K9J13_06725 [Saprospiraceae bacterium]|nr:hypothetical protein [Saprospiraceae bacterium]
MDTGDLSDETYRAIMIEAEMFNHDLTLQFGLLSSDCEDEKDFIEKSIQLINEMKKYDKIDLDDMFFGNPPKMNNFHAALTRICDNIVKLKKIPIENRTYD